MILLYLTSSGERKFRSVRAFLSTHSCSLLFGDYFCVQRRSFCFAARIHRCSWPRRGKLLRDVDTLRIHAALCSFRSIRGDIRSILACARASKAAFVVDVRDLRYDNRDVTDS
jgi:hypothetical protein